jgi:hypothetical protein
MVYFLFFTQKKRKQTKYQDKILISQLYRPSTKGLVKFQIPRKITGGNHHNWIL